MNPKYPKEWLERVPAEVIGCLNPGVLRVLILPGSGALQGGTHWDVPMEMIPAELRMPNTRLWLRLNDEMKIDRVWRREE